MLGSRAWNLVQLSPVFSCSPDASSSAFSIAAALHAKATVATIPVDRMRAYLIGSRRRLPAQDQRLNLGMAL
jgi:hypothetical protein